MAIIFSSFIFYSPQYSFPLSIHKNTAIFSQRPAKRVKTKTNQKY